MRNKQAIIGIIAAFVILFGAIGVFALNRTKIPEPNSTINTATKETKNPASTLASIIGSGKTQKCSFSSKNESSQTKGTAYLSGKKLRTDLSTQVNGKTSMVYVIRNGDENYIWGTEFPNNTGMKITMSMDEMMGKSDTSNEAQKYFDANMDVDYKCENWNVDEKILTPPTNIKFQDLSEMMQMMLKNVSKTPTSSTGSNECSICNSLTGDAKSACLKQFKC